MTTTDVRRQAAETGRADIDTAQQEAREAEQLLAALEERVRAGDPGVKPTELRDARELVGFARLRVEAAERRAARLATEARHQLYATLGAEARALDLGDDAAFTDAFTEALSALHRLWERSAQRSTLVRDMAARTGALVQLADQHGERDVLRAAGVHNGSPASMNGPATVAVIGEDGAGHRLTDVPPHHLVAGVLARALDLVGVRLDGDPGLSLATAARVFPELSTAVPAAEQDQVEVTADE